MASSSYNCKAVFIHHSNLQLAYTVGVSSPPLWIMYRNVVVLKNTGNTGTPVTVSGLPMRAWPVIRSSVVERGRQEWGHGTEGRSEERVLMYRNAKYCM